MMRVILASSNQGKLKEFDKILLPLKFSLTSLQDFNLASVEETGLSFVENAILKARDASQKTGLAAIADDSGLEVSALSGAPGIYSARYAGENASDQDNIDKLIETLKTVPENKRQAQFRCVLVFMRHKDDPAPLISEGCWQGEIILEPHGNNGFGYDPVFYLPEQRCTVAQLPDEQKNTQSHRAKALQQLLQKLKAEL